MNRSYRKKENLVLTAIMLIVVMLSVGLLILSCSDDSGSGSGTGNGNGNGDGGDEPCTTCDCGADPCGCGDECPPVGPFTLTASQLGLINNETGTAIVTAMNKRWLAANPTNSTSPTDEFYPLTLLSTDLSGTILKYGYILGAFPIRFYISGNDLNVYAASGGGGTTTIKYDIAIVRIIDGLGWFIEGTNKNVPSGTSATSTTIVQNTPTTLFSLTSGVITNVSGLNEYRVYAIVKNVANVNGTGDFSSSMPTRNVVQVYPDPENK